MPADGREGIFDRWASIYGASSLQPGWCTHDCGFVEAVGIDGKGGVAETKTQVKIRRTPAPEPGAPAGDTLLRNWASC